MTLRLVALMTIVLMLSLACFAVLMGHYQGRVMTEVERIVSEIGRATVRSIEVEHLRGGLAFVARPHGMARPAGDPAGDLNVAGWVEEVLHAVDTKSGTDTPGQAGEATAVAADTDTDADASRRARRTTVWFFADGKHPRIVEAQNARSGQQLSSSADVGGLVDEFALERSQQGDEEQTRFTFRFEDVRTMDDPTRGLVLHIPRERQAGARTIARFEQPIGSGATAARTAVATAETSDPDDSHAIVLPVPTEQLQQLAAATRRQSMILFVAVVLLGTALSAAFAHRFTRPVRRLDAGIHRLSAGDLDVAVEIAGNDEIGRLGRAFNQMAAGLRAAHERARQAARRDKLASLGRMAAGVAHDVRNPLHSIGLTLQHLSETCRPAGGDAEREFDRSIDLIRDEIRRLDQLVGNFLGFTRSDPAEVEPVAPRELLTEVARLVERDAVRRGIGVTVTTPDNLPSLAVVPGSVRSAILNLVLNSFDATPDGGRVTLGAHRDGDETILEVTDTGRGIPEADQERVFDLDYSTRDDGHGLGLAMVHQVVVEDHGGRVSLESRPGAGTTVRLHFPPAVAS